MSEPTDSARHGEPRDRILAAAAAAFAEKGFDGAGVDEIARRAGVNKAMLYDHVGDKAALYGTVLLDAVERAHAGVRRLLEEVADPRRQIAGIQGVFLSLFREAPEIPRLLLREIADGGVRLPDEALARMASVMEMTRRVVEEGHRCGALRAVNPILTHLLVVGSAMFIVNAQRVRSRMAQVIDIPPHVPADLSTFGADLSDIILNGVAARGERP
jgi:AcrR family transcriptional regulator